MATQNIAEFEVPAHLLAFFINDDVEGLDARELADAINLRAELEEAGIETHWMSLADDDSEGYFGSFKGEGCLMYDCIAPERD